MPTDDFYDRMYSELDRLEELQESKEFEKKRIASELKEVELYLLDRQLRERRKQQMAEGYTSLNVLVSQHAQLKRIADFKGNKITEIGVEMADQYIKEFMTEHGEVMKEMEELQMRMETLRGKIQK